MLQFPLLSDPVLRSSTVQVNSEKFFHSHIHWTHRLFELNLFGLDLPLTSKEAALIGDEVLPNRAAAQKPSARLHYLAYSLCSTKKGMHEIKRNTHCF